MQERAIPRDQLLLLTVIHPSSCHYHYCGWIYKDEIFIIPHKAQQGLKNTYSTICTGLFYASLIIQYIKITEIDKPFELLWCSQYQNKLTVQLYPWLCDHLGHQDVSYLGSCICVDRERKLHQRRGWAEIFQSLLILLSRSRWLWANYDSMKFKYIDKKYGDLRGWAWNAQAYR